MTEPLQPTPDDATLPGRADATRVTAPDAATLPAATPPRVQQRPVVSQLPARERYALGCEVARGGMGAILRATDLSIKRTVAMKVVLAAAAEDEDALRRFTQEAELTGQLEHPNIVPVHDLSSDDQDRPFYTMKFVKGVTLHDILAKLKAGDAATVAQYSLAQLLTIFQKVCDAVAFAHSNSVIHRDLKPANIMVGEYGEVLVMDWGLAKVVGGERSAISGQRSEGGKTHSWARVSDPAHPPTEGLVVPQKTCGPEIEDRRQTELAALNAQLSPLNSQPAPALTLAGQIMGSPQYMAPEQAAGEVDKLDARTDIFALGGILYHILTLHPPVSGESVEQMLENILAGEILPPIYYNTKTGRKLGGTIKVGEKTFPQPPLIPLRHCPEGRIPESLGAVAMKALALQQADRYPSVLEFQKDIAAYQGGFATGAEKANAWRQLALLVKRHKKEFMLAAVAMLVLLGTVTGFLVKVVHEKNRAEVEKQHAQTERDRAEKTLVSLRETAPVFRDQAAAETREQRLVEALKKIEYAIELRPDVAEYHYLKGNLLQTSLRFAEAQELYQATLARDPAHVLAQENLTLCNKLRAENVGRDELPRATLKELRGAMIRQGRLHEANILLPRLGKDIPLMVDACSKAIGHNGTANLINGDTIQVALNNAVDSFSMLRGLRFDILIANRCQVTDLSPLHGIALTEFYYASTPVSDLSPLKGMPLTVLTISGAKVTDLSPLTATPLKLLHFDGNSKIADLTPLTGMPLTNLSAAFTEIHDLTPLRGMPLQYLNLCACRPVADLKPLEGMPLNYLNIQSTSVKDLKPLRDMPLHYLYCTMTRVADLSPLQGMPLEELHLNGTPAGDLTPLRGMPLRTLELPDNSRDLTPLADCRQLECVTVRSQCPGIDFLRSLPNLKQIGPDMSHLLPSAEFWKQYDAKKVGATGKKSTNP